MWHVPLPPARLVCAVGAERDVGGPGLARAPRVPVGAATEAQRPRDVEGFVKGEEELLDVDANVLHIASPKPMPVPGAR